MTEEKSLSDSALVALTSWHDRLVAGEDSAPLPCSEMEDGERQRLDRMQDCLRLLERVRKQQAGAALSPDIPYHIGRFEIERRLNGGGQGVVFVAFDPVLNRRVALKLPRPETLVTSGLRERFLRESRAAAQFNHPNLVQVFEAGEAGPACYIVSAFCEGPNLAEFLRDSAAPAAIAETAELLASVADGVEHIHRLGVLHRDIKPSNILLDPLPQSEPDSAIPGSLHRYLPKLTDFGLAKFMDGEVGHTHSGTLIGTVGYMSPEQARGDLKQIGPATDVYALGAVLYEMLTGNQPYRGSSDAESLQGLLSRDEPAAPRQLRPELPRDLEAICQKCLEKEPEKRYQTAHELAADLRRFLACEPTLARPLSTFGRLARWSSRNRVQAALAAAVLLTFAVGSLVSALFAVQASRRAAEADVERKAAVKAQHAAEQQGELARRNQYLALMNLAQQAWNSGNVAQCLEILQRLVPQPHQTDLRGFEYYHLYRLCHQNVLTLKGHSAAVMSIAQSADGRVLLSGGVDGKLLVWNVEQGKLTNTLAENLHPELRPDAGQLIGGIREVAISSDGKLAASATFEEIQVWEVASGARLHTIKKGGGDSFGLTFSPDGSLLAASVPLNVVRMWDTRSGEERKLFRIGLLDGAISSIAFSPDGETLAMATGLPVGAATIRFVNVSSGREIAKRLSGHGAVILALAFSPNGRLLASGGADQRIYVWDLESRQTIASLQGHRGFITSLAFSPDAKQCISASADHTVRVWNLERQELVSTLRGHTDIVTGLLLSPLDGKLITASGDSSVRMWARDLKSSHAVDFTTAPTSSLERTSPLLAAIAGAAERPHLVTSVSIAPDRRRVAALVVGPNSKGTVELRTVSGEAENRRFVDPENVEQSFACSGLSPDGSLLAAGKGSYLSTFLTAAMGMRPRPYSREVLLWNVATGAVAHRLAGHQFDIFCLDFSRSGNLLATADIGGVVRVWNVQTGKQIASFAGPDQTLTDVRFSPDGSYVAAASAFKDSVHIWNVETSEEVRLQTRFPTAVTFSPDGEQLAVGSGSFLAERSSAHGEVTVWDWRQKTPQFSLGGHTQFVMRVFYTPDGMRLWSIGFDGTARLWDLQTHYEIARLDGDFNVGMSADLTDDGNQIAVGTENGKVILWDATRQP